MVKIIDWAGYECFNGKTFDNFDDAEDFLCELLVHYETERGEYLIVDADE